MTRLGIRCLVMTLAVMASMAHGQRIAVIAKGDKRLSDLVIAKLSGKDSIELVERERIATVLKEQKISGWGVKPAQALKVGKLLKADLIVILQSDEKKNPSGMVVFDAKTGVRYWDSAIPFDEKTDFDGSAEFADKAVAASIGKYEKRRKKTLKYVSLVSMQNVNLPRKDSHLVRAMEIFLNRRLSQLPGVVVLEREYLSTLNDERKLPGMEWTNDLLSATTTLEIDLEAVPAAKGYKLSIRFSNKGKATMTCESTSIEGLAQAFCTAFSTREGIRGGGDKPDRSREAQRFLHEYRKTRDVEDLMAFHALSPETPSKELVTHYFFPAAFYLSMDPLNASDLERLQMAVDLHGKWFKDDLKTRFEFAGATLRVWRSKKLSGEDKVTAQRVSDYCRDRMRERIKARLQKWQGKQPKTFKELKQFSETVRGLLLGYKHMSPDLRHELIVPMLRDFISVTDTYYKEFSKKERRFVSSSSMCVFDDFIALAKENSAASASDMRDLYGSMLVAKAPPLRIAGLCGLVILDNCERTDEAELRAAIRKDMSKLSPVLRKSLKPLGKGYATCKSYCYTAPTRFGFHFPDSRLKQIVHEELDYSSGPIFEVMAERKEFTPPVAWGAVSSPYDSQRKEPGLKKKRLKYLKMVEALYEMPELEYLSPGTHEQNRKKHMSEIRRFRKGHGLDPKDVQKPITVGEVKKVTSFYTGAHPQEAGGYLYGIGHDKPGACWFRRMEIATRKVEDLYVIPKVRVTRRSLESFDNTLIHNKYFLWGSGSGMVVCPLDPKGKPSVYSTDNGLPENFIQSFAPLGDTVYFCVAEDGSIIQDLWVYSADMKKGTLKLISSTKRRFKKTPLEKHKVSKVAAMVSDPERERIIFFPYSSPNTVLEYKPATDTWKALPIKWPHYWGPTVLDRRGKTLLWQGCICTFDKAKGTLQVLRGEQPRAKKKYPVAYPKLFGSAERIGPPYALTDTHFYGVNDIEQVCAIDLKTGKTQVLFRPEKRVHRFEYLDVSSDGKYAFVGKWTQLWIIPLTPEPGEKK